MSAIDVYERALAEEGPLVALAEDGTRHHLALDVWLAAVGPVDERLLERAVGPVLDVGCGPGRHVHALSSRGVLALGVDVSPVAVRIARARGAAAVEASIFDQIPGAGAWRSALLLDGNIGIGGRPAALLRRVAALLAPSGTVLVELDPPGTGLVDLRMRLMGGGMESDWFDWAHVGADVVDGPAKAAGLHVTARWHDSGRWFAELQLGDASPGDEPKEDVLVPARKGSR